jgi:hypothetical protein
MIKYANLMDNYLENSKAFDIPKTRSGEKDP